MFWTYQTDLWLSDHKPILIKKHGRRQISIVRYGFDHLRRILFDLDEHEADYFQSLQFLSCTQITILNMLVKLNHWNDAVYFHNYQDS